MINFANSETCRRCGAELPPIDMVPCPRSSVPGAQTSAAPIEGRGFGRWVLWILGVTATILISCYVSLLASSDGISAEERQAVARAIDELERAGFSRESFALRHVVSYRSTDNWWNNYVGHQTAYAATNFPFAVVTLYPTFFKYPWTTSNARRSCCTSRITSWAEMNRRRYRASGSRRASWGGRPPGTATRACGRTHASGHPEVCRCSSVAARMVNRTVWSNRILDLLILD